MEIESLNRKLSSIVASSQLQALSKTDFEKYLLMFGEIVQKNKGRQRQLPASSEPKQDHTNFVEPIEQIDKSQVIEEVPAKKPDETVLIEQS